VQTSVSLAAQERNGKLLIGLIITKGLDRDHNRAERLQIMLTGAELEAVDDFRFKQRMPTRAAAVRELFRLGMASQGITIAAPKQKSAAFGVLKKPDSKNQISRGVGCGEGRRVSPQG
jgi:hypothetical protein